jgi:TPR repeat protein
VLLLGVKYAFGKGVLKDDKQAVYWYQKAADQGYAEAQSILGVMYANGKGVLKDDKQAVYWYQKAADQGLAEAQYNLGFMYVNGKGVLKDYKQAVYWCQHAFAISIHNPKNRLSFCIPLISCFLIPVHGQKAADQGYAKAQSNLGIAYAFGKGVFLIRLCH